MLTGNRGVIHDPDTRTILGRRWTTKSWIACACEWKGKRRDVWGRNGRNGHAGWSELFFLDEVTALAAGHRPCFECRRQAATAFAAAFASGNRLPAIRAPQMDRILHGQRWLSSADAPRQLSHAELKNLPDGAMIRSGTAFYAIRDGKCLPWDFAGYGATKPPSQLPAPLMLVTPPAIVAALAAGYRPQWHASANAPAA